jgi:hypothetical protein
MKIMTQNDQNRFRNCYTEILCYVEIYIYIKNFIFDLFLIKKNNAYLEINQFFFFFCNDIFLKNDLMTSQKAKQKHLI